ncbi:thymidine kinase 2-like protein [Dinothrombium tinctorium]|uniref:Thymidine kinase 2-like protein n=1 Tax=Dinothrombium tinctorium TaxID=1965070 RepID=A0A3S3NZQ4_9ACAR|nr:thymidine kinase 2-like protein [Dinothrombium tinctorium]
MMTTVIVEGNIASGKSTFLNYFKRKFANRVSLCFEPLHKWRDVNGYNLFDLLYKDSQRWNFAFQMFSDLTRLQIHESRTNERVKIMERSLFSAKHCFVENSYQKKLVSEVEYLILNEWFNFYTKQRNLKVDFIVYLKTTPEVCLQRIKLRNRSEEEDYLKSLHDLHEKWLSNESDKTLIVIDANRTQDQLQSSYEKCAEIIFNKRDCPKTLFLDKEPVMKV